MSLTLKITAGLIEYQYDLERNADVRVAYFDRVSGPFSTIPLTGLAREQLRLGAGGELQLEAAFALELEYLNRVRFGFGPIGAGRGEGEVLTSIIRNKMRNFFVAIAVSAALPVSVSAQSLQQGGQYSNDDRRVSVGLTIPLGGGGSHAERKPRIEMTFDHQRRDADGFEVRELANLESPRPVRLGLTLSEKPRMMLNGREIPELDERKNISTGVWIGVGVVAAVGLAAYVAIMTQPPYD